MYIEVYLFLEEIEEYSWFSKIGNPINNWKIKQAESLEMALKAMEEQRWKNKYASNASRHPVWLVANKKAFQMIRNKSGDLSFDAEERIAKCAAMDIAGAAMEIFTR